jgi:hypothetical protein
MAIQSILPPDTLMALMEKGALSKEFLDEYQAQLQVDDNVEKIDQAKNEASTQLAQAIQEDPMTAEIVTDAAKKLGIQVDNLFGRVVGPESSGNPNAVGPEIPGQGTAKGLGQLMDATGQELANKRGVEYKPFDPAQNEMLSKDYLKELLTKYGGDEAKAVMAYNAGMGNVDKAINAASRAFGTPTPTPQQIGQFLPKPQETMPYLQKVMAGATPTPSGAATPGINPNVPLSNNQAAPGNPGVRLSSGIAQPPQALPDPNQMPPEVVSKPVGVQQPETIAKEDMQTASLNAADKAAEAGDVMSVAGIKQRGLEMQAQAAVQEAAIEKNLGKASVAALEGVYAEATGKAQQAAQDIQKMKDEVNQIFQEQKTAIAEYSKLTLDPNRIYANQTTEQKIIAAIGMGLASLGSGPNQAVAVMQKAIDRDLEIQKANIDIKQNSINARNSLLSQLNTQFGNTIAAENLAKSVMLERAKNKVEQLKVNAQSQKAAANAQKIIGELEVQKADAIQKAQEASSVDVLTKQVTSPEGEINYGALPPNRQALAVPGVGIAVSPTAATKLQSSKASFDTGLEVLKSIENARDKYGVEVLPTAEAKTTASQVRQFHVLIRNMEQTGALDAGTLKVVQDILPEDLLSKGQIKLIGFKDPVMAQIKEAEDYVRRSFMNRAKSSLAVMDPKFESMLFRRDVKKDAQDITNTNED